jgi:hypothetical protein
VIDRSFEQLPAANSMFSGILSGGVGTYCSALAVIGIVPYAANPGIRPRPDRIEGFTVPGTAFRADEISGDFRDWQTLGQAEHLGIEIEVPLRPAIATVDFQELPLADQIPNCNRLKADRLWLATAPGLVAIRLQLHQFGKAGDQLGDPACLIGRQPSVRDGNSAIRLAVDMRQDNAVGIDDPVSARHRFDRPGLGEAARGHRGTVSDAMMARNGAVVAGSRVRRSAALVYTGLAGAGTHADASTQLTGPCYQPIEGRGTGSD